MKNFIIFIVVIIIIILGVSIFNNKEEIVDNNQQNTNLSSAVLLSNISDDFKGRVVDIDLASSSLTWFAEKIAIVKHTGNVKFSDGKVLLSKEGEILGGEVIVDMSTIDESKNNETVIKHLKSGDFFDVEKYPTSKLVITHIEKQSDGYYLAEADLTIRDITAPVELTLNVDTANENQMEINTKFNVNRTVYGANFGSESLFAELGDKAIRDWVDFTVTLVLPKEI